jgi:hypothetical protein
MRKTIAFSSALVIGVSLASCTGYSEMAAAPEAAPLPGRECLYLDRINGFNPGGRNRIFVEGSGRDVYEFETTEVCPNLNSSFHIALEARGGDSVVCKGQDVDLVVRETTGQPRRCIVKMVRKLSPEEGRAAIRAKS